MSKLVVKWTPEGASPREWTIDLVRPAWDLMFQTEVATDWPWSEFVDKLALDSAIAARALLFTLRKRDEARLAIESVTVEPGTLAFDYPPTAKKATSVKKAKTDESGSDEESGEA